MQPRLDVGGVIRRVFSIYVDQASVLMPAAAVVFVFTGILRTVLVAASPVLALLAARAGGSENIRKLGGIAFRAPVLAGLFLIVTLATLAMPGSSNFVGEFLILLGVFKTKLAIAVIAFTGVVMASVYALRMLIRAMHNRVGADVDSREISIRDGLVLVGVRDHGEHRPEDLLLRDRRLGVYVGEDRRLDEPSPVESLRAPAPGRDAAAVGLTLGDVGLDAVPLTPGCQRSHLRRRVERVADQDARERGREGVDELVVLGSRDDDPSQR